MSDIKLYQPSNGTEGDWFIERWCGECAKMPISPEAKNQCQILCKTMAYSTSDKEYPTQWRYENDAPVCTAFKSREEYNRERRGRLSPSKDDETGDLF